jgi:hypothetical protein
LPDRPGTHGEHMRAAVIEGEPERVSDEHTAVEGALSSPGAGAR